MEQHEEKAPLTYDEILTLLEQLESGELEEKGSLKDLEEINHFITTLAKEGILPGDPDKVEIEEDIEELLEDDSIYQVGDYGDYVIVPAIIRGDSSYRTILCGGWLSKKWKKTKKFVKKHKKAIVIGAVVVVAVTAVAVGIAAASSVAGAAAAAGSSANSDDPPSQPKSETPPPISQNSAPILDSAIEEEIAAFKETLAQEDFFQSGNEVPIEEIGRVVGPLFAHDSFNYLNSELPKHPHFSSEISDFKEEMHFTPPTDPHLTDYGHYKIDKQFGADYTPLFTNEPQGVNLGALTYQMRGEKALSLGYYDQAVQDLGKAITLNPVEPTPYLKRSTTYFNMGDYDRSNKDFQTYTEQLSQNVLFSSVDFTAGFKDGIPQGLWESGKGLGLFVYEFITQPIHTAHEVIGAFSTLAELVGNDDWGLIAQALVPEVCSLVENWDTLSPYEKGKQTGFALTKFGADIAAPGAIAKVASKSAKCAKQLTTACRNLKLAKETLILEAAAGIGDTAKVAEIVQSGQKTLRLAKELGYSRQQIGKLKQVGQLETTIANTYEHLSLPMKESVKLFRNAAEKLKPYRGKYLPEPDVRKLISSTGIPTFPRPKGIPENFRVKLSKKSAGMKYVHPNNEQIQVRVMPGKPHSMNPSQQKPYVVHIKNGKAFDKAGKLIAQDSAEAHIPLSEYIYRE